MKNKGEQKRRKLPALGIKTHIWLSFMFFTLLVIALIWLFQYVLLKSHYQGMKMNDLSQAADEISESVEVGDIQFRIREIAFQNSFCIIVTNSQCGYEIGENAMGSYSVIDSDRRNNYSRYLYDLKNRLADSGKKAIAVSAADGDDPIKRMIYVTTIKGLSGAEHYLFIESSLEPIDSTVNIIMQQLWIITVILLIAAFIITMIVSRRLSKPLVSLTNTAEVFAKGNYKVNFDQSQYKEIEQLSQVLNYAGSEVSKVNELRRDLIANVSHDLRTPLTIIKSYAEMIRDLSGDVPEKREQHLAVIIDESDRLSNLVNSILELSKLESAARELHIQPFEINGKLREVMQRYRVLNERDGYNITLQTDGEAMCAADVALIEQVFYNLINNAVNYCGEDKAVLVRQINKESCVRVEVTDHGKGIPKEQLPQIFDRYYRAPKATRDVIGTGLGLSIVKEILKQHRFLFGVMSEENVGSTFWVEIARAQEEE